MIYGLTGKYKDLFVDSIHLESAFENIKTTIDDINYYLGKIEDVLDFLTECKAKWSIVENKIEFEDEAQISKYNSLLVEVSKASEELQ